MDGFFRHLAKFIELCSEEKEILMEFFWTKKYAKHAYIHREGHISNELIYILKGAVKTYYIDDFGKEHVVMLGIEDWWTGDLSSYISKTPADFNVQCVEDTLVLKLNRSKHEEMLERIPKMERFFRMLIERAYVASQKRIIHSHSKTAKERYDEFRKNYPFIVNRFPQYLVASYLGISKEFLSKIRVKN